MADRVKFSWSLSAGVVDAVHDRCEERGRPVGRFVEAAMREYLDDDELASVEEKLASISAALGCERSGREKKFSTDPRGRDGPTAAISCYVPPELLERFKANVRETRGSSYYYGAELENALRERLTNSRVDRLEAKADRILDAVEDGVDTTTSTEKGATERRLDAICDALPDDEPFTLTEYKDAVREETILDPDGGTALDSYLRNTLERKGMVPHPGRGGEAFIPSTLPSAPEVTNPANLPYESLTDADMRLVIKTAVLRKADETPIAQGVKFTVRDAVDALGGRPTKRTVRARMLEIAERFDGFDTRTDEDGDPFLRIDRTAVQNNPHNDDALVLAGWLDPDEGDVDGLDASATMTIGRAPADD